MMRKADWLIPIGLMRIPTIVSGCTDDRDRWVSADADTNFDGSAVIVPESGRTM